MMSNNINEMVCPKCGEIGKMVRFERDIFIVRKTMELSIRSLYGCKSCTNVFVYEDNLQKEVDGIDLKDIFNDIPTGKREDISTRSPVKSKRVVNRHR